MKRTLVRRVKQAIRRSKKSQNQFGRDIGLSIAHFSKLLNGEANVGIGSALKLAAGTGIWAGEFLTPEKRALLPQQQPQTQLPQQQDRGRSLDVTHGVSQIV